jgi:hypothetical protein
MQNLPDEQDAVTGVRVARGTYRERLAAIERLIAETDALVKT